MTAAELREKIRAIIPTVYKAQIKSDTAAVEFDELTKFPELKAVIVDLLTSDFNSFYLPLIGLPPNLQHFV